MRQIKFRGKRIDNGEWVFGDLCNNLGTGFSIMPKPFFGTVIFTDEEETQFNQEEDGLAIGGWFSVIPETVGQLQYTNKNGREYYDGDIYYHAGYGEDIVSELCEIQDALIHGTSDDIEHIIGNIHEHKHLTP